jgi:hypothetical protein
VKPPRRNDLQIQVDSFNAQVPVGTVVRYWLGARNGQPSGVGAIKHPATVLGGHTAVGWIEGHGAIALSHIDATGSSDR